MAFHEQFFDSPCRHRRPDHCHPGIYSARKGGRRMGLFLRQMCCVLRESRREAVQQLLHEATQGQTAFEGLSRVFELESNGGLADHVRGSSSSEGGRRYSPCHGQEMWWVSARCSGITAVCEVTFDRAVTQADRRTASRGVRRVPTPPSSTSARGAPASLSSAGATRRCCCPSAARRSPPVRAPASCRAAASRTA